eukprot:CAMPEP_0177601558 /NCGR_PEP_ID=MMETSP0419_2-20121207/14334_1 /TAXON_ID=582737 /ORGANISM="Tetraselmis sp., Strain GSL018" /LENGTH=86 /DNA_ID=CAMNT_0019094853 /DNA_START=70 /DNA_END=330 /DNA_ORIENTATION=-
MKGGVHPLLKRMTVVLTNGASVEMVTTSTRHKPYKLQKDILNHPHWNPEISQVDLSAGQVSRFLKRFEISEEEVSEGLTERTGKRR